jgi:caffeoyl-CoA O-methyltransferase
VTKILTSQQIEDYAERHTTPEPAHLAALNRETNLKRGDAVMLSGHIQGAMLQMFSHMVRPMQVLEVGTYTGYSAICLAAGLQPGGHLHTIDIEEELEDMAAKYIEQAGLRSSITQHIGKAADIIPSLPGPFDLVFIDADKAGYDHYYDLVFPKVPVGGYILADNVLYDGDVILPTDQQGRNARAMDAFNHKMQADSRIQHLLLPVRDGVMVVRKLRD